MVLVPTAASENVTKITFPPLGSITTLVGAATLQGAVPTVFELQFPIEVPFPEAVAVAVIMSFAAKVKPDCDQLPPDTVVVDPVATPFIYT
ncbi:hypothetical protein D3C85_1319780 [compost metagenome]